MSLAVGRDRVYAASIQLKILNAALRDTPRIIEEIVVVLVVVRTHPDDIRESREAAYGCKPANLVAVRAKVIGVILIEESIEENQKTKFTSFFTRLRKGKPFIK